MDRFTEEAMMMPCLQIYCPLYVHFLRWGKQTLKSDLGCLASACSLHFTSDVVHINVCMHTLHWNHKSQYYNQYTAQSSGSHYTNAVRERELSHWIWDPKPSIDWDITHLQSSLENVRRFYFYHYCNVTFIVYISY